MRLCVGTAKGIVILDADRVGAPLMVLADPNSIWCMTQDCRDPNLIYGGAVQYAHLGNSRGATSLSRSTDGGRSWKDITPRGVREADIWAVATPPDGRDELFIGTSHARLFRSSDQGRNFEECKTFLNVPGRDRWSFPSPPHIPHIRAITFDPSSPKTMYIGVEEGGVIRSGDRGTSFEVLNHGIYTDIHCIAVDPSDSCRLYATTGAGFYLSETAGRSWRRVTQGLTRTYTVPLMIDRADTGIIYTAAAAGPPPTWTSHVDGADARIFRSLDHGESFSPIAVEEVGPMRTMVMRLVPNPFDPEGLFALAADGAVMRSRDRGETFMPIATRLPPAYDMVVLP